MMILEFGILQGILERGLLFSLIVCSMFLTSRIIKFDDLTIEGSFGLGGAVMAWCMLHHLPPLIGMSCAILAGIISGCATGLLHTKLKLNNLISGLVTTTALFSLNLKITGSNAAVSSLKSIFEHVPTMLAPIKHLAILAPLAICVTALIIWFLKTEVGILLRAVGNNPQLLTSLGKSTHQFQILGLALANGTTALAGSLFVQYTGYFSIWSNVGILIIALASLIIAESISGKMGMHLLLGATAYQAIMALTFEMNIDQDWNKLVTALLITTLIALRLITQKRENV